MLAIAAGKHVLVEKPVASTVADAREMYTAAAAKGVMLQVGAYKPQRVLAQVKRFPLPYHLLRVVVLQEGMWTRFFPAVEQVRPVIFDIIADEKCSNFRRCHHRLRTAKGSTAHIKCGCLRYNLQYGLTAAGRAPGQARQLIADGALGEIKMAHSEFCFNAGAVHSTPG